MFKGIIVVLVLDPSNTVDIPYKPEIFINPVHYESYDECQKNVIPVVQVWAEDQNIDIKKNKFDYFCVKLTEVIHP